jgi:hypothetical protein
MPMPMPPAPARTPHPADIPACRCIAMAAWVAGQVKKGSGWLGSYKADAAEDVFRRLDTDNSGYLNFAEVPASLSFFPGATIRAGCLVRFWEGGGALIALLPSWGRSSRPSGAWATTRRTRRCAMP